MSEILCIGEPLFELNQQADGTFLPGFGGDVSNVAIAAARQGASVGMISRVGHDLFGKQFLDLWEREAVDRKLVTIDTEAPTGVYFVIHDKDGHHFEYRRKGSAASRLRPRDIPEEAVRRAGIVHASGISLAIGSGPRDAVFRAIEIARNSGTTVSFDPNLRLALWPLDRARVETDRAMRQCDIALPSLEDARFLTGKTDPDKIVDFYLELGVDVVALTLASNGALIATRKDRQFVGGRDAKVLDATGAGDCFSGAMLAQLAMGVHPFEAGAYATVAATLSTSGYGAVAPIPHRQEVLEAIRE